MIPLKGTYLYIHLQASKLLDQNIKNCGTARIRMTPLAVTNLYIDANNRITVNLAINLIENHTFESAPILLIPFLVKRLYTRRSALKPSIN